MFTLYGLKVITKTSTYSAVTRAARPQRQETLQTHPKQPNTASKSISRDTRGLTKSTTTCLFSPFKPIFFPHRPEKTQIIQISGLQHCNACSYCNILLPISSSIIKEWKKINENCKAATLICSHNPCCYTCSLIIEYLLVLSSVQPHLCTKNTENVCTCE